MHKIASKEFTLDDFSWDKLLWTNCNLFEVEWDKGLFHRDIQPQEFLGNYIIPSLNRCREKYLAALKTEEETGLSAKDIWWQMIQLLPSSYNQRRTIFLSYEVLANIYPMRKNHKLDEWRDFCEWIKTLPYSELITKEKEND